MILGAVFFRPSFAVAVTSQKMETKEGLGMRVRCYINQGGLDPALRELDSQSSLLNYQQPDWKVVEQRAVAHCQVRFQRQSGSLVIYTKAPLNLSPRPQEIFINYGVADYWLPFLATKADTLPPDDPHLLFFLVDTLPSDDPHLLFLLRALGSPQCNWSLSLKNTLKSILSIPLPPDPHLPWPQLTHLRRKRGPLPSPP